MLAAIFDTVIAGARGRVGVYRLLTERKTGVKHAEVVTTRLLQDERGWLRLAS